MSPGINTTLSLETMSDSNVDISEYSPVKVKKIPIFKPRTRTKYVPSEKAAEKKHVREIDKTSDDSSKEFTYIPSSMMQTHVTSQRPASPTTEIHYPNEIDYPNPNHHSYTIQICWCLFHCFNRDKPRDFISLPSSSSSVSETTHSPHTHTRGRYPPFRRPTPIFKSTMPNCNVPTTTL